MELREMLNDKRAQEVAILQSRHQLEWEKIKEQCLKEKDDLKSKYQQELGIKIWELWTRNWNSVSIFLPLCVPVLT